MWVMVLAGALVALGSGRDRAAMADDPDLATPPCSHPSDDLGATAAFDTSTSDTPDHFDNGPVPGDEAAGDAQPAGDGSQYRYEYPESKGDSYGEFGASAEYSESYYANYGYRAANSGDAESEPATSEPTQDTCRSSDMATTQSDGADTKEDETNTESDEAVTESDDADTEPDETATEPDETATETQQPEAEPAQDDTGSETINTDPECRNDEAVTGNECPADEPAEEQGMTTDEPAMNDSPAVDSPAGDSNTDEGTADTDKGTADTDEGTADESDSRESTTDEPAGEQATMDGSTTDDSPMDDSSMDDSTTEESATEESPADESSAGESAMDEPAAEDAVTEQPEEAPVEQPAIEEPSVGEPAIGPLCPPPPCEESTTQEPAAQEPAAQEPTTQELTTQEPAVQEPITQEPAAQEPAAQEPAAQEPVLEEPTADEAAAEEAYLQEPADCPLGNEMESGIELFRWGPDELLAGEDQKLLRILETMCEEPSSRRRATLNDYLQGLGMEAVAFSRRFEEVTGIDAAGLADDVPGAAALLGSYRLIERGELGMEEGVDLLRRSLKDLSPDWIEGVRTITADAYRDAYGDPSTPVNDESGMGPATLDGKSLLDVLGGLILGSLRSVGQSAWSASTSLSQSDFVRLIYASMEGKTANQGGVDRF